VPTRFAEHFLAIDFWQFTARIMLCSDKTDCPAWRKTSDHWMVAEWLGLAKFSRLEKTADPTAFEDLQ
jgi:hypothetical protein